MYQRQMIYSICCSTLQNMSLVYNTTFDGNFTMPNLLICNHFKLKSILNEVEGAAHPE